MNRLKVIVFLLGLASLAGILLAFVLSSGPLLVGGDLAPKSPVIDGFSPGCQMALVLGFLLPAALVPGATALGLWLLARRRWAAGEAFIASLPAREAAFQTILDRLALDQSGAGGGHWSGEAAAGAAAMDGLQQARLWRFLEHCGRQPPGPQVDGRPVPEAVWSTRTIRLLAHLFAAVGGFCFLWAGLTYVASVSTQAGRLAGLPRNPGPTEALFAMLGCAAPGTAGVLGSIGLGLLLRREQRRRQRHEVFRDQAREVLVERCLQRIGALGRVGLPGSSMSFPVGRIARASAFDALSELDGVRKARLLVGILCGSGGRAIDLRGADLRGASLAQVDLSGACLAGSDFSGAVLKRARLDRADLRDSRFQGADLREASAAGADLRGCLLSGAKLHRCNLSAADLRSADLRGANLFKAELGGADLRGTLLQGEQPAANAGRGGTA